MCPLSIDEAVEQVVEAGPPSPIGDIDHGTIIKIRVGGGSSTYQPQGIFFETGSKRVEISFKPKSGREHFSINLDARPDFTVSVKGEGLWMVDDFEAPAKQVDRIYFRKVGDGGKRRTRGGADPSYMGPRDRERARRSYTGPR